jgi:hypothetical protein
MVMCLCKASRLAAVNLIAVAAFALATTASAQTLSSATINGTVTDESGAVLPGVTVTCKSPALQVPSLTTVTDSEGRYRFLDLRLGVYQLQYELQGFQPLTRDGLEISAGFAARVNVVLKVGAVTESVTVTGVGPVVDLESTRGGRTVPGTLIANLPGGKNVTDVVLMTPGLVPQAGAGDNPAALGQNTRARFTSYGVNSDNTNSTLMFDGLPTQVNSPIPNVAASEEVDVKTFGYGPEVKEPGAVINMIIKTGGNAFHGRYFDETMWQPSGNLDDNLRKRGLTIGQDLQYFNDLHGDLGGRVMRDKLWFYGAVRDRRNKTALPGLVLNAGPDGKYLTGDEPAALPKGYATNYIAKLAYQMTPKYQFVGFGTKDRNFSEVDIQTAPFGAPASASNLARVPWERTNTADWNYTFMKGEVRGTPRENLLFTVHFGRSVYTIDWLVKPEAINLPDTYNRNTLLLTGSGNPHISDSQQYNASADVTFVPRGSIAGRHEFKFGYSAQVRHMGSILLSNPAGDYALLFDTVNGVPDQGIQIETQNAPVYPKHWDNYYSGYVADRWRIGSRLTFNLGVRFDHTHSYVPEQSRETGQFARAETFPRVEVGKWNALVPRVAVAWDVTGGGQTVAKATYGWFNIGSDLSATYNKNARFTTTYRWRDLNGNRRYESGETDLNTNGLDFVSTTNTANTLLNPELDLGLQKETTASLEHELAPNLAIRGLYVYKRLTNTFASINVLRPYSAYNIPITRRDPGADGALGTADDGDLVALFDYAAAFRGSNFVGNMNTNRPSGRDDFYQSAELELNRRLANNWGFLTSFTATKSHEWLVPIAQSPNDESFPLNTSWRWNFKVNGTHNLPRDIVVGAIVDVYSGFLGQRTYVFRPTDASGPPLVQLASVTMRLEPFGTQREAVQPVVNLRVGKKFTFDKKSLRASFDVLNVANANGVKGATYVSGPSFGTVTSIQSPRLLRVGVSFEF